MWKALVLIPVFRYQNMAEMPVTSTNRKAASIVPGIIGKTWGEQQWEGFSGDVQCSREGQSKFGTCDQTSAETNDGPRVRFCYRAKKRLKGIENMMGRVWKEEGLMFRKEIHNTSQAPGRCEFGVCWQTTEDPEEAGLGFSGSTGLGCWCLRQWSTVECVDWVLPELCGQGWISLVLPFRVRQLVTARFDKMEHRRRRGKAGRFRAENNRGLGAQSIEEQELAN